MTMLAHTFCAMDKRPRVLFPWYGIDNCLKCWIRLQSTEESESEENS